MMNQTALATARLLWARLRNIKSLMQNFFSNPVVVLCYHRVAARQSDLNALAVTPDNFRAQLEYLKRNFAIVRFEDDWSNIRVPAVAVTFDDGYADNLQAALPIIEAAGVPVTFFLSTAAIGSGDVFWWDALEGSLLRKSAYPDSFTLCDSRPGSTWPTVTLAQRQSLFRTLHNLFLQSTAAQRTEWLKQIRAWAGEDKWIVGENRLMTPEEVKTMAASPWVTIGAHTVTHPRLSTLSEQEQRREIMESKQDLEKLLGREITVFSYPFGKKGDYTMTSVDICREAGFSKAAAAFPGEAYRWSDRYQLPRHFVYNWDVATFASYLRGRWIG